MKRHTLLRLAAMAIVALAALASTGSAASKKPSLQLWTIQRTENTVETNAAKTYKAANVHVQIFANDPYKQKIKVSLGSGKGPDLFMNWGGGGLRQYVNANKVLDLTPYLNADKTWKNRFFNNVLQTAAFDGKYYGIPNVGMQPVLLFYNKAVFRANGLSAPQTWSDLINVVTKLKNAGITPFILGGQSKWPDLMWEEYLVDRVGGPKVFNDIAAGKKNAWLNPAVIKANTLIQQLVDAGAFGSNFSSTTYDGTVTATLLGTGKGAMELMGNWEYGAVLQNAPDLLKANDLGWMRFPSVSGGKGNIKDIAGNTSNFYSIAKKTKNPAAAVAFLKKQIMNKAYVNGLIKLGNIPPVKGIASKLSTGSNATFTTWCYNLVQSAPNYQHSWDQVLSPDAATALLTNLDQLFLKQITPQQFSANMNKVK